MKVDLNKFDIIIVNSSAGKDSLCALWQIVQMADSQGYSRKNIIVSHQCLGESEWPGTLELAKKQAEYFNCGGFKVVRRRNKNGENETLLQYALRRGKWPSSQQRWCTSDFKRDPGKRVVTSLTRDMGECSVLYVFGFRAQESPSRAKKEVFAINKALTTKKRKVIDYLPIHDWSEVEVWDVIKSNKLPYHPAYDLGMPRLSCVFCIFSPFDALVIAGKNNPGLLDKYVAIEKKIKHTFKQKESLLQVKEAIDQGYEPGQVSNWIM